MPGLFVTATGTGVGKTYVTAALIRAGRRAGLAMDAFKPIMTGFDPARPEQTDAGVLLGALGYPVTPEFLAAIAPWRFAAPLAPNMAVAAEGTHLDFDAVVDRCRRAISAERTTLVEGIGGVMVPLDGRHTVLDLIAALTLPVLLVTGSQLGALSHCLTAYEVLRLRGNVPSLIVLNESLGSTVPIDQTRDTIAAFCTETPVIVVPRNAGADIEDGLVQAVISTITDGRG